MKISFVIATICLILAWALERKDFNDSQANFKFMSRAHSMIYRGVAAFIIVIKHVNGFTTNIFTPLGGIGVAIFLISSGYGLNESYKMRWGVLAQ